MIKRSDVRTKICEALQTEYVALLGQRGTGVKTLISTLVKNGSPSTGMKFIPVLLPRVAKEDAFKSLFLEYLIDAIPEKELADNVSQEIKSQKNADSRLRKALYTLGKKTTANYLVIVLHALAEVPYEPLKDLLTIINEYYGHMRTGGEAGRRLRFLVAGDAKLWCLCYYRLAELSPFNIAQRIFLDGLSCEELQEMDTNANYDTAVRLRDLTGGIPLLVEQATHDIKSSNDLTPFFSLLQETWSALHHDLQRLLIKLIEGSEEFPMCDLDPDCPDIPEIEEFKSPWMEAFWGGFLRMRYRQLAWRSQIYQAFVMKYSNVQYNSSISSVVKVDLRERTERLEKALKNTNYSRNSHEPFEEAQSLAFQTYSTELASLLEMSQDGEKSETIVKKAEELAALSERDWIRKLGKEAPQHKEAINTFLIEAIIARANHFLSVQFDVFLCHNGKDKAEVKQIGKQRKDNGILPWLDEWELPPGKPWQRLLEQQIAQVKSAAVFIGPHGIGSWQNEELEALLREFKKRNCPVIPVFLISAPEEMEPPAFLYNRTWVDFRKQEPDPLKQLIWGIKEKI